MRRVLLQVLLQGPAAGGDSELRRPQGAAAGCCRLGVAQGAVVACCCRVLLQGAAAGCCYAGCCCAGCCCRPRLRVAPGLLRGAIARCRRVVLQVLHAETQSYAGCCCRCCCQPRLRVAKGLLQGAAAGQTQICAGCCRRVCCGDWELLQAGCFCTQAQTRCCGRVLWQGTVVGCCCRSELRRVLLEGVPQGAVGQRRGAVAGRGSELRRVGQS